jgi:acetoin utilization protein AcuB
MARDPITIYNDATLRDAAQIMLENKISGLPALNRQGKLVGIITESDIFRLVARTWREVQPSQKEWAGA